MAVTSDRNTITRAGERYDFPVAASVTIYAGTLVALGTDGFARPAANADNLAVVVGYATASVAGGAADGDVLVNVSRDEALFEKSGTITLADVGRVAYAMDNETVAITSAAATFKVPVGAVTDVDDAGVWVGFQYGITG
jgi:hypothetical protein